MKKIKTIICITAILFSFTAVSYARTTAENLAEVEKLFMEGKHEWVVSDATKLIDAGAHGREELFYLKALSQTQLGMFGRARETLRYMVERYPRGKRGFDGYIAIGDAYFLEGKIPESVTSYNEALNNYPDHKNASAAYYKIGCAYQKMGIGGKAGEYFAKVKNISPLSFESKMIPRDNAPANAGFLAPAKLNQEAEQSDTGGDYYVQVGYFKSKNNAKKLTEKLRLKGYDSYMSTQIESGLPFYRAKVGRFKTKAEAEAMAGKLRSDGLKTKICR